MLFNTLANFSPRTGALAGDGSGHRSSVASRAGVRMRRRVTLPTSILAAVLVLAACGGGDSTSDGPGQSKSDPTDGMVDVGDRSIAVECTGSGSPTVVLESGLGGDTRTWENVAPAIAKTTRVCTYDRANVGDSDPAPKPRSARDMVEDLDATIEAAGEKSPLVLVGFSFGGLVSQLYASSHPDDIAGLVLVESNHPDEDDVFSSHLTPAQIREDRAAMKNNPEGVDLIASFEQVQAKKLPAVPLVVVSAGRSDGWPPGWDPKVFDRLHDQLQRDLAKRAPGGKQVIAKDSGHDVPREQPDLIIAAIEDVLSR